MHERLFEQCPDPSIAAGFVINKLCGEERGVNARRLDDTRAGQALLGIHGHSRLFMHGELQLADLMGSIGGRLHVLH